MYPRTRRRATRAETPDRRYCGMTAALILAFQIAASAPVTGGVSSLGDIDGSYCLETGYCRAPAPAYQAPPPGVLFLAIGLVTLGVVRLRNRQGPAR